MSRLMFVGVYVDATPKEMMLQNIQEMIYIKMEDKAATPATLRKDLTDWCCGDKSKIKAVDKWLDYQKEGRPEITDDTIVVPADGVHYIQFDMRPEGT